MTEKTLKKMLHYLGSNANYKDLKEIKNYIEDKEKKQGITQEEWEIIFELFCGNGALALQKWILQKKIQLMQVDNDAIRYVLIVTGHFAPRLGETKKMVERLSLLLEYAPEERKREFLGTAFVIACGYNNIYLVKFLLEQGVDVDFHYQGMTGLEVSKKYAESMEGYEDDTVYQYLLRNQNCEGELEDVLKYYVPKKDLWGKHDGLVYETEATIRKEEDEKKLDSKICRYRAECRAADYEYDNLLDDTTSAHILLEILDYYNWGDGVELPYYIAMHKNCELAIALRIFYDGEGFFKFLDKPFYEKQSSDKKWVCLIETVYSRIVNGCYSKKELHYTIPLDDEDKAELKKQGVPDIMWKDV